MADLATTFQFELVSPERKLVSAPAWQVTLPGDMGDVGVRAGHMALVVSMRAGVVTIETSDNGVKERIFVAGGFADIGADHCTILAEQAFEVSKLNAEKLEQELKHLGEDLSVATTDFERANIAERQVLVNAMIDAVRAA
jgi:F-type H+-transporting ATPase subunit epsilon